MNETQQAITNLIERKLREGITHPGDPKRDVPPMPIALPFTPRPGQPKEMTDLLDKTVEVLAEAIVHTIVTEGDVELVPRAEAKTLRRTMGTGTPMNVVPIHCRCDVNRQDPLVVLSFTDPDCIVVDARPMLSALHKRAVECPHD